MLVIVGESDCIFLSRSDYLFQIFPNPKKEYVNVTRHFHPMILKVARSSCPWKQVETFSGTRALLRLLFWFNLDPFVTSTTNITDEYFHTCMYYWTIYLPCNRWSYVFRSWHKVLIFFFCPADEETDMLHVVQKDPGSGRWTSVTDLQLTQTKNRDAVVFDLRTARPKYVTYTFQYCDVK